MQPKEGQTYCPRCGMIGLVPEPGGLSEYDGRVSHLPRHGTCFETLMPKDARSYVRRRIINKSEFPFLIK